MPRPVHELSESSCRGLSGIFTDLDDTLTEGGRVVPEAFMALHRARQAGLRTVIITGRPAGWVDHLARMWPVDGVVGENGGLWFWHDGTRLQRRFLQPAQQRARNQLRLGSRDGGASLYFTDGDQREHGFVSSYTKEDSIC